MTAAPAPYDRETALLVVDIQNDFADPGGSLAVRDGAGVIPVIADEIAAAREAGALIAYSQDWHPGVTPHFAKDGGVWPVHCVKGSWGAELHPDLPVDGHVVRKGSNGEDGYSAFTMRDPLTGTSVETELHPLLASRGVRRVVLAGLATDYCVLETGLDAIRLGYETTLLVDAVRAVDLEPGDGDRAIERLRDAGATIVPRSTPPGDAPGPGRSPDDIEDHRR